MATTNTTTKNPRSKVGSVRPAKSGKKDHWELRVRGGRDKANPKAYTQPTKTVGPMTKAAAWKELTTFAAEVAANHPKPTTITVGQLMEKWYDLKVGAGRAERTLLGYRGNIDNHITPALGPIKLSKLTLADVDEFYGGLGHLKPKTVYQIHAALSGALNQAVKWEWVGRNVAKNATRPKVNMRVMKLPTQAGIDAIIAHVMAWDPAFAAYMWLAADIGARRGEVCGLQWQDLNEAMTTVQVCRSIVQRKKDHPLGQWGVKSPKSGKWRVVGVTEPIALMLNSWRRACERRAAESGVTLRPDSFVFSTVPDGLTPIMPEQATNAFRRARKATGQTHVRLHDLRHFNASVLLAMGVPIATVQARLGHDMPSTTVNLYMHALPGDDARAIAVLEKLGVGANAAELIAGIAVA